MRVTDQEICLSKGAQLIDELKQPIIETQMLPSANNARTLILRTKNSDISITGHFNMSIEKPEPLGGCGVIVVQDGKVLLGWRADGQGWALAGGKIESTETSYAAAMRELKEEFGLKASRLSYLCTVECDVFRHGEPVHAVSKIFVCQYNNINIVGAEHPSDGEMQLLQWFPLDTNFDDWKDSMFPPTYKALEHYKRETMEG